MTTLERTISDSAGGDTTHAVEVVGEMRGEV
jgi:hypothetical protein